MRIAALSLVVLCLAACTRDGPPLVVTDVEVTSPRPGMKMSAGYLTIRNNSAQTISINRVESPQFGAVELHESTIENGVARMRPIASLDVAPDSSVSLERGGKHLMLMRPQGNLETITLHFYSGDELKVSVETRSPSATQ